MALLTRDELIGLVEYFKLRVKDPWSKELLLEALVVSKRATLILALATSPCTRLKQVWQALGLVYSKLQQAQLSWAIEPRAMPTFRRHGSSPFAAKAIGVKLQIMLRQLLISCLLLNACSNSTALCSPRSGSGCVPRTEAWCIVVGTVHSGFVEPLDGGISCNGGSQLLVPGDGGIPEGCPSDNLITSVSTDAGIGYTTGAGTLESGQCCYPLQLPCPE